LDHFKKESGCDWRYPTQLFRSPRWKGFKVIVIIGAGLSGLSTAYFLRRGGRRDYALFEREDRPGGLVRSHVIDGFTFDYTGHFLHLRDPDIRRLVARWLGKQLPAVVRNSSIFSHGIYTRYPFQTNTYGLPVDVVKACVLGYVQARFGAVDTVFDEPTEETGLPEPRHSFARWIYEAFGSGIAKHFMIPYNDKLLGIHPRHLTSKWMERFVPPVQLEAVIEGALTDKTASLGYNASFLYPAEGGIETIGQEIARHAGTINTSHEVVRIDTRKRRVHFADGGSVEYETLVSTMPLPLLCRCLHPLPHGIADAAGKLRCSSLFAINWGIRGDRTEGRQWVYVPERKFCFYRAGCYSNAARSMAPRDHASVWIEVAYNGRRPVDRKKVRLAALDGLREMGILTGRRDIVAEWPLDIPFAYVTFDAHHAKATRTIHNHLERHNIYSIGRYGRWEYSSMEDAILQGRETANRLLGQGVRMKRPTDNAT
jgi:protoporphyrinogen oxidase